MRSLIDPKKMTQNICHTYQKQHVDMTLESVAQVFTTLMTLESVAQVFTTLMTLESIAQVFYS